MPGAHEVGARRPCLLPPLFCLPGPVRRQFNGDQVVTHLDGPALQLIIESLDLGLVQEVELYAAWWGRGVVLPGPCPCSNLHL